MIVISGGQSGADQAGLRAAKALGIETGGWAPKDWVTEDGRRETLLRSFGLKEHPLRGYPPRTRANVDLSDATVWFGLESPGYRCTRRAAEQLGRLFWENPRTPEELTFLIHESRIGCLNVAGNRESTNTGIGKIVEEFLLIALKPFAPHRNVAEGRSRAEQA
jgi:hypothetical protein